MKSNIDIKELKQFAAEIVAIKHKAGDLGLYKTMHAMEAAVMHVGWEIAEQVNNGSTILFEKPVPQSGEYVNNSKNPKKEYKKL